jgi:hypothetical protein
VYKYVAADPGKTLSSIAVTTQPTNKTYYEGEFFDKTGMVVTATYSSGPTENVTDSVVVTPAPLTAGLTSVTVSYTYGSVTKTATVSGLTVTVPSFFTVKYDITAKDTLSKSGVSPDESDATLAATYTGNAFQMTSGHSQKLTLTGYTNVKITEIKMSMRSNASGGAGSFKYTVNDGVTYTDIVAGAAFNTASWYGAWSTSYVDVTKTVNINVGSDIEFIIAATANSLYVESYQFKWEPLPPVTSVAVSPKTGTIYSGGTNNKTIQLSASVLPLDAGNKDINWTTSSASIATVNSSGLVTAIGPGTATITATAADGSGKKDTATITVTAKAISSLSKTGTASKLEYNIGESFDPTGLTFTATYNNGDTATVNHNQLTFAPETFVGGETQVVASYSGKSVTVTGITVNDIELVSLTKSGTLTKTSYFVGDTFDPNGLTFTAHYSDSSSENLSYEEITFDPSVMSFGTTEVVASYLTESTTISGIMVQQIVLNSISIKTAATKLAFKLGETFSYVGLTINANYNNGTVVKSSGFSVTGVSTMKLGVQTATITFEGKTTTYDISVTNVGANVGEYVTSPGVYNDLYTGSGNWSTTAADFNMTNSYGNYPNAKLSSTDATNGRSWTVSVGNAGNWSSHAVGANIGSNTVAHYGNNVIPTAITQITNYSTYVGSNYPLYFGMNFDISNASRFSVELFTEKALEAYVVYSLNGGSSYQVLGAKQTTETNPTVNEIIAGGQISLGANVRFGVLLVSPSSGVNNRNRIGDIAVQSYTAGTTSWVSGDFTPLQQATAFSDYVMTGIGEGAKGNCEAVLNQLNIERNAMSDLAKTEFNTNASFADARARLAYLEAWVAANSGSGSAINITSSQSIYIVIIISLLGISTLAGYYFIRKRPKEEIN